MSLGVQGKYLASSLLAARKPLSKSVYDVVLAKSGYSPVMSSERKKSGSGCKAKRHPVAKFKGAWTAEEDAVLTRWVVLEP